VRTVVRALTDSTPTPASACRASTGLVVIMTSTSAQAILAPTTRRVATTSTPTSARAGMDSADYTARSTTTTARLGRDYPLAKCLANNVFFYELAAAASSIALHCIFFTF